MLLAVIPSTGRQAGSATVRAGAGPWVRRASPENRVEDHWPRRDKNQSVHSVVLPTDEAPAGEERI